MTGRHEKTGAEKTFFIEYLICNPALGGPEPRHGLMREDGTSTSPSYGLVRAGCWGTDARQVHGFFGMSGVVVQNQPFAVHIGHNSLGETYLAGSVSVSPHMAKARPELMSDCGQLSWDLSLRAGLGAPIGPGTSRLATALGLFDTFWRCEGLKAFFAGWIELDGERFLVTENTCHGFADRNWGSELSSPWFWLGSTDLISQASGRRLDQSAFIVGTARGQLGGLGLGRHTLALLNHEGQLHEFSSIRFWRRARIETSFREDGPVNHWRVEARNASTLMEIDISCPKAEMLVMQHQSPDGGRRHNRIWSGGTGTGELRLYDRRGRDALPVDVLSVAHAGCEYGEAPARSPY